MKFRSMTTSLFMASALALVAVGEGRAQVKLDAIPADGGAKFGDWSIWRYDAGEPAIFCIHEPTRSVIYLAWVSNGWLNWRDGGGTWHVVFPFGVPERQNRDDLKIGDYLAKKPPTTTLAMGEHNFRKWNVKVGTDEILFHSSDFGDKLTIRKNSGLFVHCGREVGEKGAGKVGKVDDPKDAGGEVPINGLGRDGGARFGDWVVWRYDGADQSVFIVNQKTGYTFYMPWVSNGWMNFRAPGGDWFVVFSTGKPERQDRSDLPVGKFLDKKAPAATIAKGEARFRRWTIKVTDDEIQMNGADFGDKIVIRKDGIFTHNGREMGVRAGGAKIDDKGEPKIKAGTVKLDAVALGKGARYGEWTFWRYSDDSVFFIHDKTGKVVYLPWTSNGWINWRDGGGTWFVVFSFGAPERQNRDDLMVRDYIGKKAGDDLAIGGVVRMKQWTVRVMEDQIEMVGADFNDRIIIPRNSSVIRHNDRKIGE